MGNGGTEEGHNAIAQHLVDGAFIAVHGVHHNVDGGIEELLSGFRVEVFDQFGGVFDVGEQDGDLFAFPCQDRTGGENLLGEVLGVCASRVCSWSVTGGAAGADAMLPVQTNTSPSSSTASRWLLQSSILRSSRYASSRSNWRFRAR